MSVDRSPTLAIVQPYLTEYRRPVFEELGRLYDVTVLCDAASADYGSAPTSGDFEVRRIKLRPLIGGRLMRQPGLIRYLIDARPRKLFCFGNPRNLTLWSSLIVSKVLGIQCYLHTQGPYKHPSPSLIQRVTHSCLCALCHRCIGYAPISAEAMKSVLPTFLHHKIRCAENTFPIPPLGNIDRPACQDVLFIGRLRKGCALGMLLEAMHQVRQSYPAAKLHVIGGGELADLVSAGIPGVVYHGQVYDHHAISQIAHDCVLGVYPGDAGLSVTHYLALGLPVVVHDDITEHMGPEPSFIEFGNTGFAFQRGHVQSLATAIERALGQPERLAEMAVAARAAYDKLSQPSLAERIAAILDEP